MRYAISIHPQQSQRVLDRAVADEAQLIIDPLGLPHRSLLGFIAAGDHTTLSARLTGQRHEWLDDLMGRCCDIQLFVGERYLFNTHVTGVSVQAGAEHIAFERPGALQVMQRRRFWRAQLAPSSKVALNWDGSDGRRHVDAVLLNVSSDGLACKVACEIPDLTRGSTRVAVAFELPASSGPFQFAAVVCNHTPTSDGSHIIGMQFEVDPEDPLAAQRQQELRDFLYQPQLTMAAGAMR